MRTATLGFALIAALVTAGCGGGSGSTPAVTTASGGTTTQSENAIADTNAIGDPMNNLTNDNNATMSLQSDARSAQSIHLGICVPNASGGSHEVFSPDSAGDANSTDQQYFYDGGCAQLARDIVRVWTPGTGGSETVSATTKLYAQGSSTPSATRTNAISFVNATFDQYGFPVPANGFSRADSSSLSIAGSNTIAAGYELVMGPLSGSSEPFCSDSAGYNATGIAATGETFGWQGGVLSGGTRTVNGDGSVTWSSTHAGNGSKGAVGSLAIVSGAQNTACPIVRPDFTLTGGTTTGAYSIPVSVTYTGGLLTNLQISGATLANGNTLTITTNSAVSPTSSSFISGTIATAGVTAATFTVDAFGDGTLTVASSGAQFVITDWHVVK